MGTSGSAALVGMWTLMMAAMMLPSLAPALWRHRLALGSPGARAPTTQTTLVAVGYFGVWMVLAMAIYPLRAPLAMLVHAMPVAVGAFVVAGGALQLTAWKARQLECCRRGAAHGCGMQRGASAALVSGARLGVRCCYCCAGITATLLVVGNMSMRAMLIATAAITVERLAPGGVRIARAIGGAVVCAGLMLIARAV